MRISTKPRRRALTAKEKKTTHTHISNPLEPTDTAVRKSPRGIYRMETSVGAQCTGVIEVDKIDVATCERHNNAMTAFISARRPLSKGAERARGLKREAERSWHLVVGAPAIETNLPLLILIGLTSVRPKTYLLGGTSHHRVQLLRPPAIRSEIIMGPGAICCVRECLRPGQLFSCSQRATRNEEQILKMWTAPRRSPAAPISSVVLNEPNFCLRSSRAIIHSVHCVWSFIKNFIH